MQHYKARTLKDNVQIGNKIYQNHTLLYFTKQDSKYTLERVMHIDDTDAASLALLQTDFNFFYDVSDWNTPEEDVIIYQDDINVLHSSGQLGISELNAPPFPDSDTDSLAPLSPRNGASQPLVVLRF